MSKGSWYRPYDTKKYSDNWDKIFSKKKDEEKQDGCVRYEVDEEQLERDKELIEDEPQ
jgi:hypothetical protein